MWTFFVCFTVIRVDLDQTCSLYYTNEKVIRTNRYRWYLHALFIGITSNWHIHVWKKIAAAAQKVRFRTSFFKFFYLREEWIICYMSQFRLLLFPVFTAGGGIWFRFNMITTICLLIIDALSSSLVWLFFNYITM